MPRALLLIDNGGFALEEFGFKPFLDCDIVMTRRRMDLRVNVSISRVAVLCGIYHSAFATILRVAAFLLLACPSWPSTIFQSSGLSGSSAFRADNVKHGKEKWKRSERLIFFSLIQLAQALHASSPRLVS